MHLHDHSCGEINVPAGSPDPDTGDDASPDLGTPAGVRDGALTVLYAPGSNSQAGDSGSGNGAVDGGPAATQTVAVATSPFVIDITWDSSVSAAPAAFKTAVLSAVQYLESQFVDPVTVNITIGYGEVGGTAMEAGALGSSESFLSGYSYGAVVAALSGDAVSPADKTAVASLPSTAPVGGTFWTTTAEAKALGLSTDTTGTDGYVGFSSGVSWTYPGAAVVAAGTYDFEAVAVHELTEVMGRILLTGITIGGFPDSYSLMDLFHYQSAGVRDFSAGTPGYFSANGGVTSLGAFNTIRSGDAGDWALSVPNDSFNAFSGSGVVNAISANDLSVMDVLGWNQAPVGTAAAAALSVAAATGGVNGVQISSGLAADTMLASVGFAGGGTANAYTYALTGTDASSFTLTTFADGAVLAVGEAGLAGASGGKLYGLTVTPTDAIDNATGAASTIGVVVASGTDDTVDVAALTKGLGVSTPTFVYGLAGNDTLNGAGMTGTLFMTGGTGGDTMTGGGGVNDYLFGSVADSMPGSLDTITNFNVSNDLIDLTGLGTKLTYTGQTLTGAKLGADSIGWRQSGGDTLIYVNTSGSPRALVSASMEIKLTGLLTPTVSNFAHA
ncbi:MAG TPA: NF038122 family metalloprotease [Rhodopila sp.]|nr:NF038122 family metalloprotease [Rhodopila sp.]